jgi:hypothetical protein
MILYFNQINTEIRVVVQIKLFEINTVNKWTVMD